MKRFAALLVLFAASLTPLLAATPTVARVWRGRVPASRADAYEKYLADGVKKVFAIKDNLGAQMFRGTGDPVEFMVISYWPSREAIRAFAGTDIDKVHELPRDHEFLIAPGTVQHFDILLSTQQEPSAKP